MQKLSIVIPAYNEARTIHNILDKVDAVLLKISDNPAVILLMINIILLFAGMLLDAISIAYVFLPILAPIIAEEVGYVWMGALMGTLVAVGYLISMIGIKEDTSQLKDDPVGLRD